VNPRHRARRLALQGLCCLDVQGEHVADLVLNFVRESRELPTVLAAAEGLLLDTWADRAACDELLARHAHHWDLARLALVDRNILRLAAYEMRTAAAPLKVVIAEALHLTQEFSSAESARFVNGVLDAVAREIGGPKEG
jgi:N utilization substance protein B